MRTLVTLVRHAKSYHHKKGQPLHPGPDLTKAGKEQAKKTARFLKGFEFDLILTSDMTRALKTTEVIAKHQKRDFGVHKELAEHHVDVYEKTLFKENLTEAPGTLSQARETMKFFRQILQKNKGKKILLVSHGNVIRGCVGTAMGFPLRKSPELNLFNCSLSSFIMDGESLSSIYYLNSIDHYQKLSFKKKFKSAKFI